MYLTDEQILFPASLNSGLVPLPCHQVPLASNCTAQLPHRFVSFLEESDDSSKTVPQSLNAVLANVPTLRTDMRDELRNVSGTRNSNTHMSRALDGIVGVPETSRPLGQEIDVQSSENIRPHSSSKNAHSMKSFPKDCGKRTMRNGSSSTTIANTTLVTVFAYVSTDNVFYLK